jgi:hypothetical protein
VVAEDRVEVVVDGNTLRGACMAQPAAQSEANYSNHQNNRGTRLNLGTRPKGMLGLNSRQHKEVGLVVVFGSEGLGLRAPRLSRLRATRGCWLDLGSERRGLIRVVGFQKKEHKSSATNNYQQIKHPNTRVLIKVIVYQRYGE